MVIVWNFVTIHYLLLFSTLNNTQDLDPDNMEASFRFSELWHMGAQVSDSECGVNGVPALRPAERVSRHSINSECLAVILVQVRYHSNRRCIF